MVTSHSNCDWLKRGAGEGVREEYVPPYPDTVHPKGGVTLLGVNSTSKPGVEEAESERVRERLRERERNNTRGTGRC